LAPDAPILLNVGRLVPQKGIDRLIQAIPHVVRDRPDVRFVLVGDGMLREPLEQQARELGAGGHVVFAGRRSDVPRLLRAADLFVFPSLYEGFGLALVEAMTYGLGVVATSCSNVPEIVTDREHGVLCRPDDSASLLEAIRWALAHPGEMGEMGRKARSRAAEFTEEKMINATLDLIERTARLREKTR
jgi:glycosyltransferase involved in cell wall biosynthesis